MRTMTIIMLTILSFFNISCKEKPNSQTDIDLLEATTEKAAEVVSETMDLSERSESPQTEEKEIVENKMEEASVDEEKSQDEDKTRSESKKEEQSSMVVSEKNEVKVNAPAKKDDVISNEPKAEVAVEKEEVLNGDLDGERKNEGSYGRPDHSVFNTLLSQHVSSAGKVDYDGMKADVTKLNAYLEDLAANPVEDSWSRSEKLAYWINAYNAFTIKLILDNYPVGSIQDIANGKPWDKKWIELGGKTYSLNQIENDIIRPQFNEPRIHFAVNCAAKSCPPLANKAFTADNLNSLLEKQTRSFVNNDKYNTIGKNEVQISKIFDWYGKDFSDKIAFLNKYSDTEISKDAKISYSEYDWALNN